MKNLFILFFLATNFVAYSQELPTSPENGFTFPIGTKFTIKLHPTDSTHYDYSIIAFEPFEETIDTYENDYLFAETGEDETIEFYFCLSTSGDTEKEKEENMKVLLLMKNRTKNPLLYSSDIQTEKNGKFKETSNVGTFPGAIGAEIWPYMIYQIGLHDFRKRK